MRLAALAGLMVVCAAMPAAAAPAQYDIAFVSEFAEACVPQRLSYPGTMETALAQGWAEVASTHSPELQALMQKAEREASAPDIKATFEYTIFSKSILEQPHYLLVAHIASDLGTEAAPDIHTTIGCYLYNLDAVEPIDPEPVTALIGKPISNSQVDMHLNAWAWGPPCAMPRTGDTYLTFIPEVSQYTEQSGFSGLVLKFETSEPKPGEDVPATSC